MSRLRLLMLDRNRLVLGDVGLEGGHIVTTRFRAG
jgi:hypothetical protein